MRDLQPSRSLFYSLINDACKGEKGKRLKISLSCSKTNFMGGFLAWIIFVKSSKFNKIWKTKITTPWTWSGKLSHSLIQQKKKVFDLNSHFSFSFSSNGCWLESEQREVIRICVCVKKKIFNEKKVNKKFIFLLKKLLVHDR